MKQYSIIFLSILFSLLNVSCSKESIETDEVIEEIYFPSINSSTWETKSISNLNWNESSLQPLLNFLDEKNTKGFMILHNGKIVVEEYFNDHTASAAWYWASAGKTLTSTTVGIAQDNGFININNNVSNYLGEHWTSISLDKENLITCRNLLSMNSGIDDTLGDDISSNNLQYLADANTRWAYHNVYVKIQDVVENATNTTWDNYFNTHLKAPIGMTGVWIQTGNLNVFWSNTRSMARFGLLISANGKWDNVQIISENFISDATSTSQNINKSYGYLWWLNGKESYHLPQSQTTFPGSLIENAPADMFAALGKNDQKIYIIPSKDLVIIRTGESANTTNLAISSFDNELWEKLNNLID
jgi:CubicO group peptidase (beta-lactamase class C family)